MAPFSISGDQQVARNVGRDKPLPLRHALPSRKYQKKSGNSPERCVASDLPNHSGFLALNTIPRLSKSLASDSSTEPLHSSTIQPTRTSPQPATPSSP